MKNLLWAALFAVLALALGDTNVMAGGTCFNLKGSFNIKICASSCLKASFEPFCPTSCAPCGGGYGGGYACGGNDCSGAVPGPWYTYWPSGGQNVMTSPYAQQGWTYDSNFQTPAPVYPYWPSGAAQGSIVAAPFSANNYQPAGYYPSYWYGR